MDELVEGLTVSPLNSDMLSPAGSTGTRRGFEVKATHVYYTLWQFVRTIPLSDEFGDLRWDATFLDVLKSEKLVDGSFTADGLDVKIVHRQLYPLLAEEKGGKGRLAPIAVEEWVHRSLGFTVPEKGGTKKGAKEEGGDEEEVTGRQGNFVAP